jgi:zinc-finger binding domain of transposase IS66
LHVIGETVSEMLDHMLAQLRVIRIRRLRYGCRACGTIHQSGLVSRKELIEIRMTVDAAFWVRNANVSAPIPQKFNGLFDRRRSRVPFERQCPG